MKFRGNYDRATNFVLVLVVVVALARPWMSLCRGSALGPWSRLTSAGHVIVVVLLVADRLALPVI